MVARNQSILIGLRLHAGGNRKDRPDWFSKEVCISSLLRSAQLARAAGLGVRLVAFVDEAAGPLSIGLSDRLRNFDDVIRYVGGSSRKSWQFHLGWLRRNAGREDVIYLVEDDHLHSVEAISALREMPSEYGLLYSLSKMADKKVSSGDFTWVMTRRGVSSFAISRAAFQRDNRLLSFMSYAGPAFDMLTWNVVTGKEYFSIREVLAPLRPRPPFTSTSPAKTLYQIFWRVLANAISLGRPRRQPTALDPSGSTHAELAWLAPGVDWARVAKESDQ